jgi:hypothetical protein
MILILILMLLLRRQKGVGGNWSELRLIRRWYRRGRC